MKRFILIKTYPNCPYEIGQVVTQTKGGSYFGQGLSGRISADVVEQHPDFWKQIDTLIRQDGIIVEVITTKGKHFKVGDLVQHFDDPKDIGRIDKFVSINNTISVIYGVGEVSKKRKELVLYEFDYYQNGIDYIVHSPTTSEEMVASLNNEKTLFKEFVDFETGRFLTVCVEVSPDGRNINVGASICNPQDVFNKELGRKISKGRANSERTMTKFKIVEERKETFTEKELFELADNYADQFFKFIGTKFL